MQWQPIETYDALPKLAQPELAVFWFAGTPPNRGSNARYGLLPMMQATRVYGNRVCSHWCPLPPPPSEKGKA